MSKVGKKPLRIPEGVTIELRDEHEVFIKGPKGELSVAVYPTFSVVIENEEVSLRPKKERMSKFERSMWGTNAALIRNAAEGVKEGFEKKLEIHGVGYRAAAEGRGIVLSLGFSHPVKYEPPEGIELKVEKNTIAVSGIDKALVGRVAAKIRSFKKPEPYKGKGIKYKGEVIRRKAGKKMVSAG